LFHTIKTLIHKLSNRAKEKSIELFYYDYVLIALRFVYTGDVGLAFSPSNAISIEIFPSFQIAIAGDSDNI
jgi:hypothetical protein